MLPALNFCDCSEEFVLVLFGERERLIRPMCQDGDDGSFFEEDPIEDNFTADDSSSSDLHDANGTTFGWARDTEDAAAKAIALRQAASRRRRFSRCAAIPRKSAATTPTLRQWQEVQAAQRRVGLTAGFTKIPKENPPTMRAFSEGYRLPTPAGMQI